MKQARKLRLTRTLAWVLLTLLMCTGCAMAIGCNVQEPERKPGNTTAAQETTNADDGEDYPQYDKDFRIMHRSNYAYEFKASDSEGANVVNDAVYSRNQVIEKRYNVSIKNLTYNNGWKDATRNTEFEQQLSTWMTAQEDACDLIAGYHRYIYPTVPANAPRCPWTGFSSSSASPRTTNGSRMRSPSMTRATSLRAKTCLPIFPACSARVTSTTSRTARSPRLWATEPSPRWKPNASSVPSAELIGAPPLDPAKALRLRTPQGGKRPLDPAREFPVARLREALGGNCLFIRNTDKTKSPPPQPRAFRIPPAGRPNQGTLKGTAP